MGWAETPAMLERARLEQPVTFLGPAGSLCGIFTPPAPRAVPAGRCVVIPGAPRFAALRGPVVAARTLAAKGFACLRFDLRGFGESAGPSALLSRDQADGGDVVIAIRHLRAVHRQSRFLLVGYCLAALCALQACRDEAEAIDGLFLASAPVMQEKLGSADIVRARQRTVGASQCRILPGRDEDASSLLRAFEAGFQALVRSRVRALFLYGAQDPLRKEFELVERRLFTSLDDEARVRLEVEVWPDRVHSLEGAPKVFERAISWVEQFHSARERRPRPAAPADVDQDAAAGTSTLETAD